MILHRLKNNEDFTEAEKAICSYILQFPKEVLDMSVRDLATVSFASTASIVRLCKKLGCSSYNDLKIKIASDLQVDHVDVDIDVDFPDLSNASVNQILKTVSSIERQAIKETENLSNTPDWISIVDAIEKASSISIYASSYSKNATINFKTNLERLGFHVHCPDYSWALQWASQVNQDDLAIFVSYSGKTGWDQIAKILNKRNMKSVSITSEGLNKLSVLTTWNIPIPKIEKLSAYNRIAPFSSVIEFQFVLDALYATLFSRHYNEYLQRLGMGLQLQGVDVEKNKEVTFETSIVSEKE